MTNKILKTINNLRRNNCFYERSNILNNGNVKAFLLNFLKQIVIVLMKYPTTSLLSIKYIFQRLLKILAHPIQYFSILAK